MENEIEKQITVSIIRIHKGFVVRTMTGYPSSSIADCEIEDEVMSTMSEALELLMFKLQDEADTYIDIKYEPVEHRIYLADDIVGLNEHGLQLLREDYAER
jgi:hypothetical protein